MASTDIPLSFNSPNFIKIFLPGFLGAIIYSLAIIPNISSSLWSSLAISEIILVWTISGIIIGMILTSVETYIYQFFEGIRFWPNIMWEKLYKNILISYINTHSKDKIREYPYLHNKKKRHPYEATRFGNVMAEYERYSEVQYGISMRVFWPHLRLLLSKENRELLDMKGAKVDFLVYLSFIFLIYTPFAGIGLSYQWIAINWNNTHNLFTFSISCIIISLISLLISYLFYKISILNLISYGQYVKAIFDFYRVDLAKKFGIELNQIPDNNEIKKWKECEDFLLDYRRP